MRVALSAIVLLLAVGIARADEPRNVPAAGTSLTYRMLITVKRHDTQTGQDSTTVTGETYTYLVKSSDGTTAQGIIKPLALILGCPVSETSESCEEARKNSSARREGDLVMVPIPDEAGDSLSKQSGFKLHYFLQEQRKFPVPGPQNPADLDGATPGPEPAFIMTNTLQCDLAAMPRFLPIGTAPQAKFPCQTTFERTASRDGHLSPATTHATTSLDVSYRGNDRLTLPSGTWETQTLLLTFATAGAAATTSQNEIQFSGKLGASVKTHSTTSNSAAQLVIENDSQLIAVSP